MGSIYGLSMIKIETVEKNLKLSFIQVYVVNETFISLTRTPH